MTVEQKEELRDLVIKIVDIFVEISRFSEVKHLQKMQKKLESDFVSCPFLGSEKKFRDLVQLLKLLMIETADQDISLGGIE